MLQGLLEQRMLILLIAGFVYAGSKLSGAGADTVDGLSLLLMALVIGQYSCVILNRIWAEVWVWEAIRYSGSDPKDGCWDMYFRIIAHFTSTELSERCWAMILENFLAEVRAEASIVFGCVAGGGRAGVCHAGVLRDEYVCFSDMNDKTDVEGGIHEERIQHPAMIDQQGINTDHRESFLNLAMKNGADETPNRKCFKQLRRGWEGEAPRANIFAWDAVEFRKTPALNPTGHSYAFTSQRASFCHPYFRNVAAGGETRKIIGEMGLYNRWQILDEAAGIEDLHEDHSIRQGTTYDMPANCHTMISACNFEMPH